MTSLTPPPVHAWRRHAATAAAALLIASAVALAHPARAARPRTGQQAAPAGDTVAGLVELRVRATARPAAVGEEAWSRAAALYEANAFAPFWLGATGLGATGLGATGLGATALDARAGALVAAVAEGDRHGLRRSDYPLDELAAALAALRGPAAPTPDALARADVLLTATLAAYAADMLAGRVRPDDVEPAWHIGTRAAVVDSLVATTLRAPQLDAALQQLAPQEAGYATLVAALARYRFIAAAGGWPQLPAGPTLRPGDAGAPVLALRARLRTERYFVDEPGGAHSAVVGVSALAGSSYVDALVDAVTRFQQRHGLAADGVVGPATRAALNVPAEERARQIAANLERYRWLPRDLGDRYILVNVPAFRLTAVDRGRPALTMRVVVGSELAGRRTPVFSDSLSYVQFGPYWNVPHSIAVGEILPQARRDRGYLARHDYELVRGWRPDAPVVDPWSLSDAELLSPRYRVRQRPGPGNALGRVKFMFPNEFNVYLHDTPAQALFAERVRAASHGCVRVADPAALAEFILRDDPTWTPARIAVTLDAGARARVPLARKLPVYLLYLTAFDRDGAVAFRDDLYGMDARLIDALGDPRETPRTEALVGALRELTAAASW